jgi:hypothetical protein
MILSDGISRSRMVGFVLDGTAGCDVGIEHHSNFSLFETRIRHQNQKFLGFGQAGIRIGDGGNAPGRKESAEIIYENCIFDSCGLSPSCQLPFPPMTAMGCGGLAILNFNDYDNVVDGCHFSSNSYGIYNDKMANVYARNCRFESSTQADVYLAAAAGNSVRRSVSHGSAQFIGAPARDPGTSNPTVIMDNRVDGWTSAAGAISYSLRGPVFAFDNEFSGGPAGALPIQPIPPKDSNYTFWIIANNLVDGKPAGDAALVKPQPNIQVYDLDAMVVPAGKPTVPPSPLTAATVFLKPEWPTPTQIFDVTTFGANGTDHLDDTAGIQAAIDAAAKAGKGAMAYVPTGNYQINKTLQISGEDFWLAGSGLTSSIAFPCPPPPPAPKPPPGTKKKPVSCAGAPPALLVSKVSNVSIEMMQLKSGGDQLFVSGGSGIHNLKLDGIYAVNAATNTEQWNGTSTIHIDSLATGETVHAIHLDGNVNVSNSAAGTVIVGMMIQSSLHVNKGGSTDTLPHTAVSARSPTDPPPLGFLTFIGLVDDYDVVVQDDQSVVIEDLYCEQLKTGHLLLSGSGGTVPGRVVIQGVKSESDTAAYAEINNYHGSLYYQSSMFLEKSFPAWDITQTGSAEFNMTLIGNDFDANDDNFLQITMGAGGKKGSLNMIANSVSNFSDIACGQANPPVPDKINDPSMWLVRQALDDFRRLGVADLQMNHPSVWKSGTTGA